MLAVAFLPINLVPVGFQQDYSITINNRKHPRKIWNKVDSIHFFYWNYTHSTTYALDHESTRGPRTDSCLGLRDGLDNQEKEFFVLFFFKVSVYISQGPSCVVVHDLAFHLLEIMHKFCFISSVFLSETSFGYFPIVAKRKNALHAWASAAPNFRRWFLLWFNHPQKIWNKQLCTYLFFRS